MRMLPWNLALLSLVLLAPGTAQEPSKYEVSLPAGTENPWIFGGGYHHSSTYEEGAQRGFADIVRSGGLANLYNSAAANNWEAARRKSMENRIFGTESYFQLRDYNRQARAAERGPRPSTEDLIRYAKQGKPQPLSDSELDPLNGYISWPALLRGEAFEASRKTVETLFAQRAILGGLSGEQTLQAGTAIEQMRTELKSNIKNYPTNAYIGAKKFLDSLAFASYQPST